MALHITVPPIPNFRVEDQKIFNQGTVYYRLTNVRQPISDWLESQPKDWYYKILGPRGKWYYDINEKLYTMLLLRWN